VRIPILALFMILLAACATRTATTTTAPVATSAPAASPVTAPTLTREPRVAETRSAETRAAEASPTTAPTPTAAPKIVPTSTPQPQSISIVLGPPQQLFHADKPDALGMQGVPDQPLTPIQQPDTSYHLFIVGGEIGGIRGGTGLISTKDFMTYTPISGTVAQTLFPPSCRDSSPVSCSSNYDADYAGADLVFPSSDGKNLRMLYQGVSKDFGGTISSGSFYSVVGLAASADNGITWTRRGAVISGSDPKPSSNPKPGANGADQSGAIVANGYIYDFYPYFPSRTAEDSSMEVARSSVASDGAPGTWTKYYDGAFGTQPGLGGLGSQVIPTTSTCRRPAQPWLAASTYLNAYIMVFVCAQGWFFSTSTDLVAWTTPIQFFTAPVPTFSNGEETNENLSLVTPGNAGQVIGQTGYVLYAQTRAWGKTPHELWVRPFTFSKKSS
jgi:hypothetical protein